VTMRVLDLDGREVHSAIKGDSKPKAPDHRQPADSHS
jgi:hypothetical protein